MTEARSTFRLLILSLLGVGTFAGCSAQSERLNDAQTARIRSVVRHEMIRQQIPGIAFAVARHGVVIYAAAFGRRGDHLPVNPETVFPIGSITKQFTAACVMLLVEAGRIRLDSRIGRYLANVPHGDKISVRELLDQTSGLPDYSAQAAMQHEIGPDKLGTVSPQALLKLIEGKPLQFEPGSRFAYSNTNYLLAGMIVGAVSGESYPAFIAQRIFRPLGLIHTQYLLTSVPVGSDVANGYKLKNGRLVQLPRFTMSWARGAGALASTVGDLAAWDAAFFSGKIVRSDLVHTAVTPPHVRGEADYAFGWVVERISGHRMIWHNGGIPGAHAMNAVFPDDDLEIVVLDNRLETDPEDIARQIFKALPE